ncbi:MAG: hypothetical protein ACTHN0_16470 [Aquihabitans sp.]
MDEGAGPNTVEVETWEAPVAAQALGRAILWFVGIGIAAGATGGFALLVQDDELRGGSFLLAAIGGVWGAVIALLPALLSGLVLSLAAERSETARTYRRWVGVTVAALGLVIPAIGLWMYRSFAYDLRDDHQPLVVALGASFVVAESMLMLMWRSLRRLRTDAADAPAVPSTIPNPFGR